MNGFKRFMWFFVAGMLMAVSAMAKDDIVARGDGFDVSRQDLLDIQAYFSEKGFETNDREYIDGALKLFLFSEEAAAKGLDAGSYAALSGKEKVGRLFQLHKLYASHFLEMQPVNNEAIESYYYAYPDKFTDKKSMLDKDRKQVYALDNEKREWIRHKILAAKKSRLLESEFQRLKEKYHVQIF